MNRSAKLELEIFNVIDKQIKGIQKNLTLFPLWFALAFFLGWCRNNGHAPEWWFYFLGVPFFFYPFLYVPIATAMFLYKTFYSVEILENGDINFTTFGTLWRSERIIVANLSDIQVHKTSLSKLLFKKYSLNVIYVGGEKYYIFSQVLEDSGLGHVSN
jgi:hypothetical protein